MGLALSLVGLREARQPGVAGRAVAITGTVVSSVAAALTVVLVVAGIAAGGGASRPPQRSRAASPAVPAVPLPPQLPDPTTAAPPGGTRGGIGEGVHQVGQDLQPGLYKSAGGAFCDWERRVTRDDAASSVLAVSLSTGGPVIAEIEPSDGWFYTEGCAPFVPYTASAKVATSAGDGDYLVGRDLAPGTYRAPGGHDCYWERDRSADGSDSAIIVNGDGEAKAQVVIVEASDVVFKTSKCGTWTALAPASPTGQGSPTGPSTSTGASAATTVADLQHRGAVGRRPRLVPVSG